MPSGAGKLPLGKGVLVFKEDGRSGSEDFLEIDDFKFNKSVEKSEKDSNRTATVKQILSVVKKTKASFSIVVAALPLEVMRFFALSDSVTDISQSSGNLTDSSFTVYLNQWIDLGKKWLSAVKVLSAGTACTFDNATDTFTATAHGMENGQKVELTATTLPTGASADTTYYVINKAADTFQLSEEAGGSSVDWSADGTAVKFHLVYISGTDYEVNATHGKLFAISGGAISDSASVLVTAAYAAKTMHSLEALTKATIKGTLEFWGDPVDGPTYEFEAYVQLNPEGDMSMISDEPSTIQLNGDCIESAARVAAGKGLYTLRDINGDSLAVSAAS